MLSTDTRAILRITAIYATAAGIWIVVSDQLLARITDAPSAFAFLSTLKGGGFIAITSLLLIALLRHEFSLRAQAEATLQESEQRFRMLYEQAPMGYQSLDESGRILEVNQTWLETFGYAREEAIGRSFEDFLTPAYRDQFRETFPKFLIAGSIQDVEFEMQRKDGAHLWGLFNGRAGYDAHGKFKQTHCILSNITERRRHDREMETIAAVTLNLRSATDRTNILPVILNQTLELLNAEGASIAVPVPETGELVIEKGSGKSEQMAGYAFPRGQGIVGQVFQTGEIFYTGDVYQDKRLFRPETVFAPAVACLPMITTGQAITGVLWVNRHLPFSQEDIRLLRIIAEIAANAVHRATIFESLAHTNEELNRSYDETIQGWSRALDLRDRETEGHSSRVTDLTFQLAKAVGVSEADLVHIRRGALLHDIGKMGIPDAILLKPGPLDPAEWEIMRQHPVYAYQLLLPISYLKAALDIPYCHHEKWDGSGYPRGLKGEEIPLAARIFAVADVWDALLSDRPYRLAYSPETARQYITEQNGRHFDPQAVELFLSSI